MKPLPPPEVPGTTDAERMNNAVRALFAAPTGSLQQRREAPEDPKGPEEAGKATLTASPGLSHQCSIVPIDRRFYQRYYCQVLGRYPTGAEFQARPEPMLSGRANPEPAESMVRLKAGSYRRILSQLEEARMGGRPALPSCTSALPHRVTRWPADSSARTAFPACSCFTST